MDMAASSTSSLLTTPSNFTGEVCQLNESVYELYKPSGRPKLQIVFFHGFQLGGYEDAHLSTWASRDDSCVWPKTWLVEEFPHAHVLSVAYNARLKKSKERGALDLHNTGENIVSDLFEAKVGQDPRCPLIVVGHSFGGIVIKQLCLHARERGLLQHNNFLQNLKGIFFYSTPHHGAEFEKFAPNVIQQSPLLENVKILSTSAARLHDKFENLRKVHYKHWQIAALGESQPTQWGLFSASVIVEEASSRYGDNFGTVEDANHMTVCRPKDKTSRAFNSLTNLLNHICTNSTVFGPVHQCRGLPDHPSGLNQRVAKATKILKDTSILGIVGMGGLGKSAIAKQLFNDSSIQFEYTCFVDNVKGISIDMLDERVVNSFYRHGTRVEKDKMEWNFLMEKKTLVVMDDVDDEKQLMVLPKLKELGNGSRLVFTSRKHDIFSIYGKHAKCYEVQFLEDDEATQLLFHHVFEADRVPNDLGHVLLGEHINGVVKKCGGLPLTLEVIGRYLRPHCHKVEFWKETIRKLGEAQSLSGDKNDRVWASLMLSYGSLAEEEQEIFIDSATCFFERPLEDALAAWSIPKGGVETSWNNLINRSLVKVVSKTGWGDSFTISHDMEYMEIWVHQHLRDLAKKLSGRKESTCHVNAFKKSVVGEVISVEGTEGRQVRFWQRMPKGWEVEAGQKLHVWQRIPFWQRITKGSSSSGADKEEHEKMQPVRRLRLAEALINLKYLRFRGDLPEWLSKPFPKNLSLLECTGSKLQRLPISGVDKLGVLRFHSCTVGADFCNLLGNLVNLRILFLTKIWGVVDFVVPEDFGNLSCLKMLVLNELQISKLPDSFGDLQALEHLKLRRLQIKELPQSFVGLHSLDTVMIQCRMLKALPETFGQLKALKVLTILEVDELKALPESFGQLAGLKTLAISYVPNLRGLCEKFGSLSAMTQLQLEHCQRLENLPLDFGLLCGLEELKLIDCGNLQRLPDTFGQLTTLKKLTIREAGHLQDLCENFGLLRGLDELELDECRELQRLPSTFSQLTMLKKLTIRRAEHLQDLCGNFGLLSGLEELELDAGPDSDRPVQTLLNNSEKLKVLKKLTLTIWKAEHLLELFDNAAGHFSAVETMELSLQRLQLKRLPDNIDFARLTTLTKLSVMHMDSLEELPDSIGHISSLREIRLVQCKGLRSLPDSFGKPLSPQHSLPRGDEASPSRTKAEDSDASGKAVWHGVTCKGCKMKPIEGSRFISTKEQYDLCSNCFEKALNENTVNQVDFVRSCQPPRANSMKLEVVSCPLLNASVLLSLGWARTTNVDPLRISFSYYHKLRLDSFLH